MKITKIDGHYFTKVNEARCEIIHPNSEGMEESVFEELIDGHVQFIYPQRQDVEKSFENINDHPELRNARVIALEWEDKHNPFPQISGMDIE
jgi:hypothetical protein